MISCFRLELIRREEARQRRLVRKLLERHVEPKDSGDKNLLVRTSGPTGPIYVEVGMDSFEVCSMYRHHSTGIVTWKVHESCLEQLQMTSEELEDFQKKAMAEASKWE